MEDRTSYSFLADGEQTESEIQSEGVPLENKPKADTSFDDSEGDGPLSFLSNKSASLIIGILVVALLVPLVIFALSKTKTSQKPTNKTAVVAKISPTPAAKQKSNGTGGSETNQTGFSQMTKGGLPVSTLGTKAYKDPTFGYSLTMPSGWEAYKNAGSANAYQMAFHPVGSADVPFTIGAQVGTNETEWINTVFGSKYPRENAKIAGKDAILVKASSYQSYYLHDNTYTYEISEALGKSEYLPIFQSILSSLTFSK